MERTGDEPDRVEGSTMLGVFGEIFPLLVSIAIHPIAAVVALTISGRPGGGRAGIHYAAGFALGIVAAIGAGQLFELVNHGTRGGGTRHLLATVDLIAGVAVLVWGVWSLTLGRKWTETGFVGKIILKAQPRSDGELMRMGFRGALLNPKDLAVSFALGTRLGVIGPEPWQAATAIIVFVFVAVLALLIPAVVAARGGAPARSLLYRLDAWIAGNLPLASAIVLIVMGANMIRSALGHLGRMP